MVSDLVIMAMLKTIDQGDYFRPIHTNRSCHHNSIALSEENFPAINNRKEALRVLEQKGLHLAPLEIYFKFLFVYRLSELLILQLYNNLLIPITKWNEILRENLQVRV